MLRVSFKDENNNDYFRYPLALKMKNLIPYSHVATMKSPERRVCEKAFELPVCFSNGCDLVEEFIAAGIWHLG